MEDGAAIFSLNSVLTGSYQQWMSRSIGVLSPMFKTSDHLEEPDLLHRCSAWPHPPMWWSARTSSCSRSPTSIEYCSRDMDTLRGTGDAWAARIRHAQDFFESRGKLFFYVITPSKVAQHPEYMPDGLQLPGRGPRPGEKIGDL